MIKDTIVLILCIIIYFGCLIELIRIKMCKININDYFYCALNNKIYLKRDRQIAISKETIELYAPIAYKLDQDHAWMHF